MIPGFEHLSPEEYVTFLEQQLAGAIQFLRQKDETEQACVRRIEALYATRFAEERETRKRLRARVEQIEKAIKDGSARYEFLRAFQVQIWKLGIAAAGEQLDQLIDAERERQTKQPVPSGESYDRRN